ncbi:hypothetical protein GCM10023310_70370 [Paenibacillus vulneris]
MNKYEWLWKTMKQHKKELVEKFEKAGKTIPIQHSSTLYVMEALELKEPENNKEKHANISMEELRGMAEGL